MDRRYDAYCAADPLFYDSLTGDAATGRQFPAAQRALPAGWDRRTHDDWVILGPAGATLPRQGWKIHVSARLDNAERLIDVVWDYCLPRGLSFKFLRSPRVALMRNSKYAPRAASGKLVTIYPVDEEALRTTLTELDAAIGGEPGPYILSDLRFGAGPLYVRYGGFAHLSCVGETGELVPALVGPDGKFEPDQRQAVFATPSWVTLPEFLRPHLAARNATTTADLPYRIDEVLHYSNAGGLYAGQETGTGRRVVLKEARPHAGLDGHGEDAVCRLRRECAMLRRVADLGIAPRVHDTFSLGGHEFAVLEYVDGQPLNRLVVRRYPLTDPDAGERELREYADWALDVVDRVERAVRAMHGRGVVHGDLHMFNVLVREDGEIRLLDFEVAADESATHRPGLRNQGFAAPRWRVGRAVDEYALACLRLALFAPLTQLIRLDVRKAAHLAEIIAANFPVGRDFLTQAVEVITSPAPGPGYPTPAGRPDAWPGLPSFGPERSAWPPLRAALTGAIAASATPDRDDRLFPGDIEQFRLGGLGIAHGAAGVLYALAESGAEVDPAHLRWLSRRAADPGFDPRHGFLDGLHGVAYVLDRLGERQRALDVVDRCLADRWETLGTDLHGGIAGIGLNLRYLADVTGEPTIALAAIRAAEIIVDRIGPVESVPTTSGGKHPYAGLTHGSSGPALLLIRTYDVTGDPGYLAAAERALRQDLRRCVSRPDGALEVDEGWRTMPYLARGSLGIGLVLDEYLARCATRNPDLTAASHAIRLAARSPMYVQSGLFAGRAGVVAYLATRSGLDAATRAGRHRAADDRRDLDAQVDRLAWHGMPYAGGLAFPGEQLLRLSMDLATGTAGVLLAVAAARHDRPVALPVLGPAPVAEPRSTPEPRTTRTAVTAPTATDDDGERR